MTLSYEQSQLYIFIDILIKRFNFNWLSERERLLFRMIIIVLGKSISVPIWRCAKCRNECLKTQYWNIGNDADQRTRTHSNCSVSSCERIYQIFFPGELQSPISYFQSSPLSSTFTHTFRQSSGQSSGPILMIEIDEKLRFWVGTSIVSTRVEYTIATLTCWNWSN